MAEPAAAAASATALATSDLLGLTVEFDVKRGYLVIDGEGALGKQHRGAFDTYTSTLMHHIERDDVVVLTRNACRPLKSAAPVSPDMVFAPRKGDRILSLNYRPLTPPSNWLHSDPPGGVQAWSVDGRRLLWKQHLEREWADALASAQSVNPTYVELDRGVGGWLSVSYEPYGLCIVWKEASALPWTAFLPSTLVMPGSDADKAGVTTGATITKVNGEKVSSFKAWSLASLFRSVACGSLPDLSKGEAVTS
ncbi:hypothetical protein T484DRAFT_1915221, partial [Baffinella frigidus]